MKLFPPGAIFCRTCGYCLFGLPENRCPECGNTFDPADDNTFHRRPKRVWPKRVMVGGIVVVLLLGTAYGGFLWWLYAGWKAEAGARALATGLTDKVETRSILPAAVSRLLIGDCRRWQERVGSITVSHRKLHSAELYAIRDCRRLIVLSLTNVTLNPEDLTPIWQCPELEELHLIGAALRGQNFDALAGMAQLKKPDLRYNSKLDDAALPPVGKLRELRGLYLVDTAVTDQGLSHLASLSNLEELDLRWCTQLTDASVPNLSCLKGLRRLWIGATSAL